MKWGRKPRALALRRYGDRRRSVNDSYYDKESSPIRSGMFIYFKNLLADSANKFLKGAIIRGEEGQRAMFPPAALPHEFLFYRADYYFTARVFILPDHFTARFFTLREQISWQL
jgi:hypothetical protein